MHGRDAVLRLAQHPQHGAVVQVALREVARRHGHRDGRQQRGEQRHEAQELLRAIDRLGHLGAARREVLHAHAAQALRLDPCLGPVGVGLRHLLVTARRTQRESPRDAAGRLHQPGGGEIGQVQHDARRQGGEAGAAVGLDRDEGRDAQRGVAQLQPVTHLQRQRLGQRRIDPGRARLRPAPERLHRGRLAELHPDAAAQGIGGIHRLDRGEPRRPALRRSGARHAGEVDRLADDQSAGDGGLRELGRHRLVGQHHGVAAQQLRGVAHEARAHAVGEQPHRAQRAHGQHHGPQQQLQFAGDEIAPHLAAGQAPHRGLRAVPDAGQCTVVRHARYGTPKRRRPPGADAAIRAFGCRALPRAIRQRH